MELEIERIFLTNEFYSDEEINDFNTNTDVIVQLRSGKKFIASFFTYQNIESIRKENVESNEFMKGKYFWKKQMVLIEDCSKDTIEKVVHHLIEEGDFKSVFKNMTN